MKSVEQALLDFLNPDLPLPPEPRGNPPGHAEEAWLDWHKTPAGMIPRWWPHRDEDGESLNPQQRMEDFLLNLEASLPSSRSEPNESATDRKSDVALSLLSMLYEVRERETDTHRDAS